MISAAETCNAELDVSVDPEFLNLFLALLASIILPVNKAWFFASRLMSLIISSTH